MCSIHLSKTSLLIVETAYTIYHSTKGTEFSGLNNLERFKNRSYGFAAHCKLALTNARIKQHSNICPNIAMTVQKVFISCTTNLFRNIFCSGNKIFNKRFCRKWTLYYSFTKSHKITYERYSCKRKRKFDTIKNDKMVKVTWVPNLGSKLREGFLKFGIFTSERYLMIRRKNCFLMAFLEFTS